MEFIIRGEKMTITEEMKNYIEEKVSRLEKYLENGQKVKATIVVKVKGKNQIVEITIPLKNVILRSEETKPDFYEAVDKASDILERQIRKNKTRIISKKLKAKEDFIFFDTFEEENDEENKIVKRKTVSVKPMDEEEAILQMELLGHQFYMFKDASTSKPAVVYKRKDNGYGLIEAE